MKSKRQETILGLIQYKKIENQARLAEELKKLGIESTQATLSRDVKALNLKKARDENGFPYYTVDESRASRDAGEKYHAILKQSVLSVDRAEFIIVVKTLPGLAQGACAQLEAVCGSRLAGAIAGDDTALLILKSAEEAKSLFREMEEQFI